MLNWLRRRLRKPPSATWRQYYLVYTKEARPPEWAQSLTAQTPLQGSFLTREESPDMFTAMPPARPSLEEKDVLSECAGAVELRAQYARDEKVFLEVARFACQMGMREFGYVASVGAYATYEAKAWLELLDTFSVEQLIGIHEVSEDEDDSMFWVHTHGLRQFELPELEVRHVPPDLVGPTGSFLNGMGEWMLSGEAFADGHTLQSPNDSDTWAVCESIRADLNEGHGEPDYPLLRLSDLDPETGERGSGLTRFLGSLAEASD